MGSEDNRAEEGQSTARVGSAWWLGQRESQGETWNWRSDRARTPLPCWNGMSGTGSAIGRAAIPPACGNERASRCWRRSTRKASRRPAKNGTRHVTRLWGNSTPFSPLRPGRRRNQFTQSRRQRVSTPQPANTVYFNFPVSD